MHATRRNPNNSEQPLCSAEFAILFSSTPRGARLARLLTVERLNAWGIPYGCTHSDTLAVLVAELATNAVCHGKVHGRDFRLRMVLGGGLVRVEVSDARGEARPVPHEPDPESGSGRGLLLVEALAARWGVTDRPPGKTVWCEYELTSRR
ncbi:ATP-binding protein [Streptomyces millisiae]|uniref:ATP-binding protein n=1 Tax=Streptomyces millisiae TaxID=3075542 RepID=A0ABU2LWY6_9ACTN|nr:ATP-binding protein [Streptomyces sp. DSM 44918]MDT0321553.1 ATP-binding protein [Streptomyces sp. DSM 44918]